MLASQYVVLAIETSSVLFITVFLCWYAYYKYCFTYWQKKGLPTIPPSFPGGNITVSLFGRLNLHVRLENIYREFQEKGFKHAGIYFLNGPVYYPIDPELLRRILTTDFEYFVDRGTYMNDEDILSKNLMSLEGNEWRSIRAKLSPAFTSKKLKSMYDMIFMRSTENLVDFMEPKAKIGEEVNIKQILNHFVSDIISNASFGLETNALSEPDTELAYVIARIFNPPYWQILKALLTGGLQNPGQFLKPMFSDKYVEKFFKNIVGDTVKYRIENDIDRNDFFSLLLEIKKKHGFSTDEMAAECYLFFAAGFESSSYTIASTLHELAHNQELQDKLRTELHEQLGTNFSKYTYDDVMQLLYLDKVVKETLRLYPVIGFLNRICVKTYKVPETDVVIDPGTPVLISLLGIQRNPDYFPNPMKYDPERFRNKNSHTPYTYIPFGEGPRSCIGMKYGLLQVKLGVAALISQYKFLPSAKTPKVIEFDKLTATLAMSKTEGMFLKVVKL